MATKSSTKNKSTLTGTSVADILTVKHDQVTVNGADGNDTIKITKGNSSKVSGGAGADAITVSLGKSHVIHGNAGNDTITIGKSAGTGIKVYGDAGNDTIKATNSYAVTFYGGDGNDTLTGGKGADKLYGDAGTDKLYGGAGNDTLSGGAGNDTLNGQAANDTLTGGAGKDTFVYTNGGSDKITDYAPGYDTLQISSGSISKTTLANSSKDLVFTVGTGKVTLINAAAKTISLKDSRGSYTASKTAITLGSNFSGTMDVAKYLGTVTTVNGKSTTKTVTVKGNAKANTLYGGSGANTLYGYAGNDKLYGYAGNDILYGGDGDDTLNGGDGNDTLYGGAGADTLTGGAGKDTFVYVNGEGNDTITDYASDQDALQIANGSVSNMALANNNKDLVFTVGDGSVTVKDAAAKSVRMQDSRGSYTVTRRTITLGSDFTGTLDAAEVMPTVTTINGEAATGNTIIKGNGNNRSIYGGMGQDQLSAEGNNNALYGGVGDDILEVVKGTGNYLSGDEGNDEYIVNWPLREEPNSGDEHHTVVIDNAFAEESDSDTLVINGADSSNFTFSLSADDARNLVIREEASGDYVVVYDWVNHGFESVTFDDKAFTNDEIREIIAEASRTKVDWHLGDTVALAASKIGTGLQINGYKENDFVVTLDSNGQLVMRDAQGGTLTISNWDENTLEAVAFKADGYKKVFTAEEFAGGIFTSITLANEEGQELVYDSGSDVCEEFDINFTTSTNIVINSANGSEDRIKFTDNHSVDNVDIQIKDNNLYLYNWDPQAKQRIDGQVVIKDIKNSTVKTIEFGEMTYHLIGEGTKIFIGSDTITDRYLFLDTVWTGTDTTVPNWEVTIDGINGQDVLDFHFLPNNSRYYDLSGQADGNDMVLTYRYSTDRVNGANLGTVRLKNFFNDDGTINTTNGYPMIRTNREIYAGDVSDSAWDSWEWVLDKNYRWLSMNAGTAGDDVIDLRNEIRPTNTKAWLYYAGPGNDTVTAQAGDIVYGGAGDDTINVTGNVSDIHGGAGVDTIVVRGADGQNLDHVIVRADKGNDIITAYGSYHYVHGGADDDEIHLRDDGKGTIIAHNSAAAGGVGNDTIIIHAGHDHRAVGGDGNDKLYAYLGDNHVLNGGAGDDEIHIIDDGTKRSENNRALGGEGNDWLYIEDSGSNHYLYGDAGNDYLSVTGGTNTLNGGTGSDTYSITNIASDTNITIDQSFYNTGDADILQLTSVNSSDVHYSLQGSVLTITHDNGGTISISGWDTNPLSKVIFADNTELTGEEVNALATVYNSVVTVNESTTYAASGTGTVFQVTGTGYDAILTGTSGLDMLDLSQYTDGEYGCNMSQSGNDLVIEVAEYTGDQVEQQTHVGTVTLEGYFATGDRLTNLRRCEYEDGSVIGVIDVKLIAGGNYNVDVSGTDGIDFIITGNGNKSVNAGAGNDYIQVGWGDAGSEGTQIINAGAGDDEISADGGQNTLNGEAGNDDIFVENTTNNTLNGGAGKDRLEAYGSGHTLNGGENDDVIISHADNSTLNGGSGNDEIVIGNGKYQVVDGGTGNDTIEIYNSFGHNISGGAGSDRFVFDTHLGSDNIVTFNQSSFNAGDTDVLELKNYNKGDISSYSLQNGVMTLETTAGGKFVIQGWDVNPLAQIQFADSQVMTGDDINGLLVTPEVVTQQSVMKSFMKSLDDSNVIVESAENALDTAVSTASNNVFTSWNGLVDGFVNDVRNFGATTIEQAKDFLATYCGINLDNDDTGAITGADAGGEVEKTAISIVPEVGTMADAIAPTGTETTINGLTLEWPSEELNEKQQVIVKAINTWWVKEGLDLVEESYGLSFTEQGTTVSKMNIEFYTDSESLTLAAVYNSHYTSGPNIGEAVSLTMRINMAKFESIDLDDVNGYAGETSGYLDRTIAHELTHAVMAANITGFNQLPDSIVEGSAELVHGIDDFRTSNIMALALSSNSEDLATALTNNQSLSHTLYENSYAAGYMLLRYFAKQVADSVNDNTSTSSSPMLANFSNDALYTFSSVSGTAVNDASLTNTEYGSSTLFVASCDYTTGGAANVIPSDSDKKGMRFT